ncbi:MAG: hypothetical protein MRZ59_06280 [Clostridiales bacterium]|nr:hypothetical protein [Clostridiales bacterium]
MENVMIQIRDTGLKGYHPDMEGDPLSVEKGYCHFRHQGQKDFLNKILAYEADSFGAGFEVETFRGRHAFVRVTFSGENVFRFQMFPEGVPASAANEVFSFKTFDGVSVVEEENFILVKTGRVCLRFRICPWEMTVVLDGRELTREQIKDHNVDQKYKAVPVGFTVDDNGKVIDAFETMYMYCDEDFYGFGEKFTVFNKRGQKITVWQRDAQSTNSDISYKGMPYFMSSQGYSVLLNTYTRTHFNMGASSGVSYTMETEDPYLDYYMFCNRDYKGLIEDYTAYTGRSPMIPKWAFGFWMSKMSYFTRQEVEEVVERMAQFGMSVDVIHIDGWMDMMSPSGGGKDVLTFDEERFPKPEEMIAGLKDKGIHLSLWMFPYVQLRTGWGQGKEMTAQYLYMKERGFLVKAPNGEPYIFSPGEGDAAGAGVAALDFTNPELVSYMKERVKRLMKMGVGVIKTDFSEEIPEDAVFYDGSSGLQSHNKYTLLYARTIFEASREAKEEMGEKALLWGRSGFAGSQNYPANWAGDSSAATNNLASILNGGLSMGMSGVSFWGFDIGGFYNCDEEGRRVIPSDEEYIRSVQMGLMSPLSRSHGQSTPREPWVFSEKAQEAFLTVNKLRYRMIPYIYSTAYETHKTGLPMMRAMVLEFPEDLNVRNLSTQYMLGSALLVAPVFDQQIHHIYLPEGSWIDYYTGKRVKGGGWIVSEKTLERIPLYIRENSVIPGFRKPPMHISDDAFGPLEIWMNITDRIEQTYYDEEEGSFRAVLEEKLLKIETKNMPVHSIRAFMRDVPERVIVNGDEWQWSEESNYIFIGNCQSYKI